MITDLLFAAALGLGQAPAQAAPMPVIPLPTVQSTERTFALQDPTQPSAPSSDSFPGNPQTAEDIKTDKEEAPPPTKYLIEKTLEGTWLGSKLNDKGIKIYGWTEMSYNASTASRSNNPVFMIDWANSFLMNQNYLVIEKKVDTEKKELQYGWAMNWILPGSDARTTLPRGLWNSQLTANNGGPTLYPIDPFQFYGQVFLPNFGDKGTTVTIGRFATHCGYELVQAPDTPFVSRSYLFQNDPFTHTGIWAVTPLNDTWTFSYGAATGSDTFIEPAQLTFLGQLKWAPKDGKSTVAFNTVVTNPKYDTSAAFPFYNYYEILFTHKLSDKLTYVLDTSIANITNVPNIGATTWYGAANYLMYAHNAKVTSILRAEVFEDTDGFRTGSKGMYTELTYGPVWKPCDSVLIRPSIRYDNNCETAAFEGSQNLFTATMDVVFRW